MDFDQLKLRVREAMQQRIPFDEMGDPKSVERYARKIVAGMAGQVDANTAARLVQAVVQETSGYGPLQALLDDPKITEIMVLGARTIYVEVAGKKQLTDVQFADENQLRLTVERMMGQSARRLDESMPYADFALPDGSRVHVIIPPLAADGTQVTIRKFSKALRGLDDLEACGTLSEDMSEYLVCCIKARQSMLFSGATGCGKTTTLAALSHHFEAQERIVVIEDTRELELNQKHVVHLLTRPPNIEGKGEIELRDLLRNSLRMRPNRILMGEIRGKEAIEFLQALNSGHRGCCGVLHASSPADAVRRLETLTLFAGLSLPVQAIRQQISAGLNIIIQQELYPDGVRRISHITEVRGLVDGEVELQDIFRYTYSGMNADGTLDGAFVAVAKPQNLTVFKQYDLPDNPASFGLPA